MNFDMRIRDVEIASKIAEFVKSRLLNNQAVIKNNEVDAVSAQEALLELKAIQDGISAWSYPLQYTSEYKKLKERCSGTIDFTDQEIDEITETLNQAIRTCGLPKNMFYFDVLTFSVVELDRLVDYKISTLPGKYENDEIYQRAVKWRDCLQLGQGPMHYQPFSAMIYCGYPRCAFMIADDDGVIYEVDNNLVVKTDNIEHILKEDITKKFSDDELDNALEVAANWWTKAFTDPMFVIRYNSNVSFISSVLALCYNMYGQQISKETSEVFKQSLKEEIKEGIEKTGHYTIKVNCDIDQSLKNAVLKADMKAIDYSLRTVMDITPEEVILKIGSGENNTQVLYSAKEKSKQKSLNKR
ncbi:MAG: hypothetical protein PUC82_04580 [bacterium]|nr:hypothetical protein [bacterium]